MITDLCMAGRLSREHYDEDDDSPFWTPDLPDDPEPGWLTDPSSVLTPIERYLAEAFRFDYVTDLQEAILARTNASLITGLSMYLEGLAEADPPGQLAAIFEKSQAAAAACSCRTRLRCRCPDCPGPPAKRRTSPG